MSRPNPHTERARKLKESATFQAYLTRVRAKSSRRYAKLRELKEAGHSMRALAAYYEVSHQRISQLLKTTHI